VFLLNSRLASLTAPRYRLVPGRTSTKGTSSYIAEFLKEGSLARLGTLIPVHLCRFRYGFDKNITTRKFLGS